MQHPDKGYRRIRDDLEHDFGIDVNDKRVLRICRAKKIKSTIKYSNHSLPVTLPIRSMWLKMYSSVIFMHQSQM